jgi:hypothetical protein
MGGGISKLDIRIMAVGIAGQLTERLSKFRPRVQKTGTEARSRAHWYGDMLMRSSLYYLLLIFSCFCREESLRTFELTLTEILEELENPRLTAEDRVALQSQRTDAMEGIEAVKWILQIDEVGHLGPLESSRQQQSTLIHI